MKKLLPFLLIASFAFSSFALKPPKKLIGYWEVVKLEQASGDVDQDRKRYVVFEKDGKMKGGKIGRSAEKEGLWSYDKKTKTLAIDADQSDDGAYDVLVLTKTELVIKSDKITVYMEKSEPKSPSSE